MSALAVPTVGEQLHAIAQLMAEASRHYRALNFAKGDNAQNAALRRMHDLAAHVRTEVPHAKG